MKLIYTALFLKFFFGKLIRNLFIKDLCKINCKIKNNALK